MEVYFNYEPISIYFSLCSWETAHWIRLSRANCLRLNKFGHWTKFISHDNDKRHSKFFFWLQPLGSRFWKIALGFRFQFQSMPKEGRCFCCFNLLVFIYYLLFKTPTLSLKNDLFEINGFNHLWIFWMANKKQPPQWHSPWNRSTSAKK